MRKQKRMIAKTEEEGDFDGIVYRLDRMPRVRRVLELLTAPDSRNKTVELRSIVGRYRLVMRPRGDGVGGVVFISAPGTEMSERDECNAVRVLLSLNAGRMKRCEWRKCNNWFYAASRADQRFCKDGNCRQNFHQSDPVKYEAKKAKQRENYRLEIERQERAKRGVGFIKTLPKSNRRTK